jgi:DNA-binding GntR family transcriptional regulator
MLPPARPSPRGRVNDPRPVDVPEAADDEEGVGAVHRRLRRLILDGALPAGAAFSQVQLAARLGVSRTPLREALRMLQAEGLIRGERNHRMRVADFDVQELESVYVTRIMLEGLAITLTVPLLSEGDLEAIAEALRVMRAQAGHDAEGWEAPHRRFHTLLVKEAPPPLFESICSHGERSERYRRIYQTTPRAWSIGDAEHESILSACRRRDPEAARDRLVRHLARTALSVAAVMTPEHEPTAVRTALQLVAGVSAGRLEAQLITSGR